MKNISNTQIILYAILLFHLFIFGHASYLLFSDFTGFNFQYFRLVGMLIFTLAWLGICLKKRIFTLIYFSLIVLELMAKMFFGSLIFGEVIGDIFFPADVLFIGVVIILYKQIFNERSSA
ncbi:MAG: hypothetical protein IT215_06605 [Chitinophagaceae bacterium]|nr:MAG: hypothetical protein UZ11_BCD004002121 [Bacteroidetes bacterium OLB11]MCC6448336.1 hypothetical protein [Chitinophagaceae bacterium]HMN32489.1 hypothetical protein [Chitinophagaceae bacterium]